MPRLWNETVEAHRHDVREAVLDAAAALVAEHGPAGVTMSRVAAGSGIGRATLYKYFPDAGAVLVAWHERQIGAHLDRLARAARGTSDPGARLAAVLAAYAAIGREHRGHLPAPALHRGEHVARARRHLHEFVTGLVAEAAAAGAVTRDVPPDELAAYCLHALGAAAELPSKAAARRLVTVTLAGLRPTT